MKNTNPFSFGFPSSLANGFDDNNEDQSIFEDYYSNDWSIPKNVLEETGIFAQDLNQDGPMFYFDMKEQSKTPQFYGEQNNQIITPECQYKEQENHEIIEQPATSKIVEEKAGPHKCVGESSNLCQSTEKTENASSRRDSTEQYDSLSDSRSKDELPSSIEKEAVVLDQNSSSPGSDTLNQLPKPVKSTVSKVSDKENSKAEEDPDFCYKAPRKQRFEYNKRKDVILKTILRRCRRIFQDEFNELTGYFDNRKMQGHQFLKDSVMKYYHSIPSKPEQLDLVFYLGAMLYPQEMCRGVDCFFECDKKERVKQRKLYRAKIQKVHDVLYRYSHERMDYFVKVPELSYLYVLFYKKETESNVDDQYYLNGATEIYERCKETLLSSNICI